MAHHLPHRENIDSRWLTATLISIYIIIAALVVLYSIDGVTSREANSKSETSRKSFQDGSDANYRLTQSK